MRIHIHFIFTYLCLIGLILNITTSFAPSFAPSVKSSIKHTKRIKQTHQRLLLPNSRRYNYRGLTPPNPSPSTSTTSLSSNPLSTLPRLLSLPPGPTSNLTFTILLSYIIQILSSLSYRTTLSSLLRSNTLPLTTHLSSILLSRPYPPTYRLGGGWTAPVMGPYAADMMFQPGLATLQIHRWITSSMVHGSLFHIFFNLSTLQSLPPFLSPIVSGPPGYILTFLFSTLTGNLLHWMLNPSTPVLGASGGICGLLGLAWITLNRSGRKTESSGVLKRVGYLLLLGCFVPGVSNASHAGGFAGGVGMGGILGFRFKKGYRSKRDVGGGMDGMRVNPHVRMIARGWEVKEPICDWKVVVGTGMLAAVGVGGFRGILRTLRYVLLILTNTGRISGVRTL